MGEDELRGLLGNGEEEGWGNLSALEEHAATAELDDDEVAGIHGRLERSRDRAHRRLRRARRRRRAALRARRGGRDDDRLDWRRGYKFSTYATWWIRQAVQRDVANKSRTIRIPAYIVEHEQQIARAERDLIATLERAPTDEEVGRRHRVRRSRRARRGGRRGSRARAERADAARRDREAPRPQKRVIKLRYAMDGDPDPQSLDTTVSGTCRRGGRQRRSGRADRRSRPDDYHGHALRHPS